MQTNNIKPWNMAIKPSNFPRSSVFLIYLEESFNFCLCIYLIYKFTENGRFKKSEVFISATEAEAAATWYEAEIGMRHSPRLARSTCLELHSPSSWVLIHFLSKYYINQCRTLYWWWLVLKKDSWYYKQNDKKESC